MFASYATLTSLHLATPIATRLSQQLPDHLPQTFYCLPAEQVAPELIGCLLVKRQPTGELLWGVGDNYSKEELCN